LALNIFVGNANCVYTNISRDEDRCKKIQTVSNPESPLNYPTSKSSEWVYIYDREVTFGPNRVATRCKAPWWIESNFLEAQSAFRHNLHKELNIEGIIDYTGVTKNPDMVIGQDFLPELDENNNEIIVHRNPEKHRDTIVIPFIENTVSVIKKFENESFLNPFRNADKRITFSLASDYGILDFLLENTRSCEGRRQQTHNFTTVCYRDIRCWWCHEREWALNNYDK
jgi:hypothetical protein